QIFVVRPDGTGLRRLTNGGKETNNLGDWTPDGWRIMMGSNRANPSSIDAYLVDREDGRVLRRAPGEAAGNLVRARQRGDWTLGAADGARGLQTFSQRDGLPPNAIHFHAEQTRDGRIFLGFEYGVAEYLPAAKPGEPKFRIFELEKINAMAEDSSGALWIGTDTKGARKLAPTGFTMFGASDGLAPADEIMSVFAGPDGAVYVASRPNKLARLVRRDRQVFVKVSYAYQR